MKEYQKINAPFKRDGAGKLIIGDWCMPELEYLADNEWEFTEKVDGTNIRVHLSRIEDDLKVRFGGRTENAQIPTELFEVLQDTFPNSPRGSGAGATVGRWMVDNDLYDVILFGEGYGPKIQKGGGNYRDDQSFVLFDVLIDNWWLKRSDVEDVASKLGIDVVPIVGRGTLSNAISLVKGDWSYTDFNTGDEVVVGPLMSRWGNFIAEGIVAKPVVQLFGRNGHRIMTKIKGVDFR